MSELEMEANGYVCAPYLHNHESVELKESLEKSRNIENLYFVTATFSPDSKPYFESSANHYLLAKFKNSKKMKATMETHYQEKPSFVFSLDENLFSREFVGNMNFVSVYYLEYGESVDDYTEVASVVGRREKVGAAGIGHMEVFSTETPKFTFPYSDHIVVLEVSSEKSHQSVNKYCEKTRSEVIRKGIAMNNLVSLSILEKLK